MLFRSSLATPPKLRRLQEALYTKAKQEPAYRFYLLYDKVYRADILAHAYALSRQHGRAPGVDGVTFEDIEAAGVEPWLAAVQEALRTETYRPQAVRRVLIPDLLTYPSREMSGFRGLAGASAARVWAVGPGRPGLSAGADG